MRMKWLYLICGLILFSRLAAQNGNESVNKDLAGLQIEELVKPETWLAIQQTTLQSGDDLFKKMVDNKALFVQANGEEKVNAKLSEVFVRELTGYALGEKNYEPAVLFRIYPMLIKTGLSQGNAAGVVYKLAQYRGKNEYASIVQTLKDEVSVLGEEWISRMNLSFDKCKGLSEKSRIAILNYLTLQSQKYPQNKEYAQLVSRFSEHEGIIFEKGNYKDFLAKAAKEKKLIFMDAYTTWCAPCKMMADEVFPQKSVGDFFNKNFICVKMDLDKGEGTELGRKFNVKSLPTFLLINKDGQVVFSVVGYRDSAEFLQVFQKALADLK